MGVAGGTSWPLSKRCGAAASCRRAGRYLPASRIRSFLSCGSKRERALRRREGSRQRFGDFVAVDRLTFDVRNGEIFGLLGANGAGKTTTIRMLAGLLRPSSGGGTVGGWDINTQFESIKKSIGYMSQRFSLYDDLTVEENLQFFAGVYGLSRARIEERTAELDEALGLGEWLGRRTAALPLGFKQRLALGAAILHRPAILFLDEPTSGVDPIARRHFWELINGLAAGGRDDHRDDALHGRGGVLQPALHHARGEDREPRLAGRAQGAARRAFDRGRVHSAREGRMRGSRIPPLARKEFKHILRDPRSLWIIFMLPNVMMFLFGYAIDLDLKDVRLGVCDMSRTPQSRALVEAIDASSYFSVVARYGNPEETGGLFERRVIRARE